MDAKHPQVCFIAFLMLCFLILEPGSFCLEIPGESGSDKPPYLREAADLEEGPIEEGPIEAPAEPSPLSLYLQTLARDIETTDYYELLAWCQRLGLDDSGDRSQLQARLYRYYQVSPEEEAERKPGKRIIIRSARQTEYFTIEEIDEDYLRLQGDVVIEFIDEEEDVVHRIRAQRIIVNQTQNILTASVMLWVLRL
ncbi:unnamed protein product [marine sediment metagenome]|uniref:SAP domain-containing protein n=1 Tax=marine sediment metagenome TaxID=412755 RepID=X1AYT9_9ZZZZ